MHPQTVYILTLKRLREGVHPVDIQKETGVPLRTIAFWRRQAGLPSRKFGPRRRPQ
jgi:hypothetical protein